MACLYTLFLYLSFAIKILCMEVRNVKIKLENRFHSENMFINFAMNKMS